jgi:hypothetical protein
MIDKITIVTPPDDVYSTGFRILTVDLTTDQLNEVSTAIKNLDSECNIIVYVWKSGSEITWLLDKVYKSNAIIFNAESSDQTLIGFLAAQHKSSYFGELRTIKEVNKSVIFDHEQCEDFFNHYLGLYGQISK